MVEQSFEGPLPHPDTLHKYDEEERALILAAYRDGTLGESERQTLIIKDYIKAMRASSRRETFNAVGVVVGQLVIIGLGVWAFVATGNPLPLALPGASVIGSIVVSVRRGGTPKEDERR